MLYKSTNIYIYVHASFQQPRVYEVPVRQEAVLYGRVCVRIRRPAVPAVAQTRRPPVKAPPGERRSHFRPSNPAAPADSKRRLPTASVACRQQASLADSKYRLPTASIACLTPPSRNGLVRRRRRSVTDVANGNDVTIRRDVIRGHCDLALAWLPVVGSVVFFLYFLFVVVFRRRGTTCPLKQRLCFDCSTTGDVLWNVSTYDVTIDVTIVADITQNVGYYCSRLNMGVYICPVGQPTPLRHLNVSMCGLTASTVLF